MSARRSGPVSQDEEASRRAARRAAMVETQLRARGIRDERVLHAFQEVPREEFVCEDWVAHAYEDSALPIEAGQTISQPYVVAWMTEALSVQADDDVLEVGTGSGYAAAILGRLARQVDTVERHEILARSAADRLARLGFENVRVHCGDGSLGWPERAPYDAIVVAAGGPAVPPALIEQLRPGGRLVMPVGERGGPQQLVRLTQRPEGGLASETLGSVRFVPLVSADA